MSDSEEEESEEEVKSLDDIQNEFYAEVGHKPHTVKQLLAYCKQKETGHKFKDINQWWPNRPEPEEKPQQKAVNADDYKDPNEQPAAANDDDDDDDDEEDDEKENDDADAPAKGDDGDKEDGDGDGDNDDEEEDEEEEEEEEEEEDEESEDE